MQTNAAQTQCPSCGNFLAGPRQCQKEGKNFGKWFKNCPTGCKGQGSFIWVDGRPGTTTGINTSMQGSYAGPQGYSNNQPTNTTQTGQVYSNQQPGQNQFNNNYAQQQPTQTQQQQRPQVFMPTNPPNNLLMPQQSNQQQGNNPTPQQNDDRLQNSQMINNKLDQIINLLTIMKNDNFNILNHLNTISQSAQLYATDDEFKNFIVMQSMKKAEQPDNEETMLN